MKKSKCIAAFVAILLIVLSFFSGCGSRSEAESIQGAIENAPSVGDAMTGTEAAADKDETTEADDKTAAEAEPEPEPEAEPEPEISEEAEALPAPDPEDFFDDAVFVGDSVTLGLRNYVAFERNEGRACLGAAEFLPAGSMGYTNTLGDIGVSNTIHPRYQGKEMYIEDALALMEAKKAFIMLGMNDFSIYPEEDILENVEELINRINEKNPGIGIYIESVTPVNRDKGNFSNANMDKFNAALKKFCEENGCTYVDVASVMKNEDGALIASYCSDPDGIGVHVTYEGCKAWVDYLNDLIVKEKLK